jgi:chorismate mutase
MTSAVNSLATESATSATDDAGTIPMLREQIDALDAAIVRIVAERARVSRRIQTARMNAGGTRVELGRERTVRNTYRDGLGSEGPALAEAVLQVCRGAR